MILPFLSISLNKMAKATDLGKSIRSDKIPQRQKLNSCGHCEIINFDTQTSIQDSDLNHFENRDMAHMKPLKSIHVKDELLQSIDA